MSVEEACSEETAGQPQCLGRCYAAVLNVQHEQHGPGCLVRITLQLQGGWGWWGIGGEGKRRRHRLSRHGMPLLQKPPVWAG